MGILLQKKIRLEFFNLLNRYAIRLQVTQIVLIKGALHNPHRLSSQKARLAIPKQQHQQKNDEFVSPMYKNNPKTIPIIDTVVMVFQ